MTLEAPRPIRPEDDLADFDCGNAGLDDWLRRRALNNDRIGASRTYVLCEGGRVIAYYALATGGIARAGAPRRVRQNMPDPIPVMVLARLAVDRRHQQCGLGSALLRDAILRTLSVAEIAGIRAMLVHAIDPAAAAFYAARGFAPSPIDPLVLMLPLDTVRVLDT